MSALEASLKAAKHAGKGGVHRQLERAANRIEKEAAAQQDGGGTKAGQPTSKARSGAKKAAKQPAKKASRKPAKRSAGQTRATAGSRKSA